MVRELLPEIDHAVQFHTILRSAVSWLTRHQYEDGSWSSSAYMQRCTDGLCLGAGREEHSLSITALATLAILESAHFSEQRLRHERQEHEDAFRQARSAHAVANLARDAARAELLRVKRLPISPENDSLASQALHHVRKAEGDLADAEASLALSRAAKEASDRAGPWLAFHTSGDAQQAFERSLAYLEMKMDPSGCVGPRKGKYLYTHALATLLFARAYALTWNPVHKYRAQRALDFLLAARTPRAGWRYTFQSQESDMTVTGWAMAAIEACRQIGLRAESTLDTELSAWLDQVTDPLNFRAGYRERGDRGWSIHGVNDHYGEHETNTATALQVRMILAQSPRTAAAAGAARRLSEDLPVMSENNLSVDYLYWYHGTHALIRHQAPAGPIWSHWREHVLRCLLRTQRPSASSGCAEGSWDQADRWGCEGGRVYATAINALTLAAVASASD